MNGPGWLQARNRGDDARAGATFEASPRGGAAVEVWGRLPMRGALLATLYTHAQLHVDIRRGRLHPAEDAFYRCLQGSVDAGLANRGMFGSDQMVWQEAIARAAERRGYRAVPRPPDDARMAIGADVDGLAHVWRTPGVSQGLAESLADRNVFVIRTLAVPGGVDNGARVALAGDPAVRRCFTDDAVARFTYSERDPRMGDSMQILEYHLASVAALHRAGVTLLAGSDPPNFGSIHGVGRLQEIELLVRAGPSEEEALRAATTRAADAFGPSDRGRIRSGLSADLALVGGDPTNDVTALRRIRRIWRGGVKFERTPVWR